MGLIPATMTKPDTYPPLPNLDNVDLRLLKVFLAVVRNGGFSAAEVELNVSQPTISTHMSQLESRLGVCLCERGRGGFQLTPEGREIHSAATQLFQAIEAFRANVGMSRRQLVGDLHIGIVDAIVTNPECRLKEAISLFNTEGNEVQIHLYIESPQNIQQGLVEERFHIGIAAFRNVPTALTTRALFKESEVLYCGAGHGFFSLGDGDITSDMIANANYVRQLDMANWTAPQAQTFNARAATADMEAMATLILSGHYIGYMAEHYAKQWVDKGQMKALLRSRLSYVSQFFVASRKAERSFLVKHFIDSLIQVSTEQGSVP